MLIVFKKIYLNNFSILIFLSLTSCGYENDKEPILEKSKIKKAFIQETQNTTREEISPLILSMIESKSLNQNNLLPIIFKVQRQVQSCTTEVVTVQHLMRPREITIFYWAP